MPRAFSARAGAACGRLHAVLGDFLFSAGQARVPASRLRIAAWFRLLIALPLILAPTALWILQAGPDGRDPDTARWITGSWFVLAAVYVVANVGILSLATSQVASRARTLRGLTFVSLTVELTTNQLVLHGVGPLTSHGVIYIVVLVAAYRVFFDHRIGLYAAVLGGALYVASIGFGVAGVLPFGSFLPSPDHPTDGEAIGPAAVLQSVLGALFVTFCAVNYAVNQSTKLHRYITETVLRRYLPPALVARAARGELRLDAEPERRTVTVMFTDLVGFTSVAERVGERDVARMLNQYLSRCADVAHAHGATIDKFIGDAVMVLLGAPDDLPPEEQARRCVAIARDMRAALEESPMPMRVGINTGEVIVGHFGSQVRSDFTAVGHAVNIAARLESVCEPGRILVGEETARLLGSDAALEPAGKVSLKGISRPVSAYYVDEGEEGLGRP